MFALHWICALTLALVSCLNAQPVKRDADELLDSLIPELNTTIGKVKCADDIRLYSPTQIRKDCMSSALNCIIQELNVLKYECDFPDKDTEAITNVIFELKESKSNITSTSSPDCSCEMYEETDVKQFLENMKIQVQHLNDMGQLTDQ